MSLINEISKVFNKHASEYERAAKVQLEIGTRLYERLPLLKINPLRILDLGCGTGCFSQSLNKMYPKAQIVGLDLAENMLKQAQKKMSWRKKWNLAAGDMHGLPFADDSFDLVFANQVIHWSNDIETLFAELFRVMKPNSCLMFSSLGLDTFREIKEAWSTIDNSTHVNIFFDMHNVGDLLNRCSFADPVMDAEHLYVRYQSFERLIHSLKAQGVKNISSERPRGLTGTKNWQQFKNNLAAIQSQSESFELTYEVIYGHAWIPSTKQSRAKPITKIPLSSIKYAKS